MTVAEDPTALTEGTAVQLYRIAQEAVTNALKHAEATVLKIEFESSVGAFDLRVSDNGHGLREGAKKGGGMGLPIMEYRAKAIGAKLEMVSRKDGGVSVRCISTASPNDDD